MSEKVKYVSLHSINNLRLISGIIMSLSLFIIIQSDKYSIVLWLFSILYTISGFISLIVIPYYRNIHLLNVIKEAKDKTLYIGLNIMLYLNTLVFVIDKLRDSYFNIQIYNGVIDSNEYTSLIGSGIGSNIYFVITVILLVIMYSSTSNIENRIKKYEDGNVYRIIVD